MLSKETKEELAFPFKMLEVSFWGSRNSATSPNYVLGKEATKGLF